MKMINCRMNELPQSGIYNLFWSLKSGNWVELLHCGVAGQRFASCDFNLSPAARECVNDCRHVSV